MSNKSAGFAHIWVAAAIVAVLLTVGVSGWLVWHKAKKQEATTTSQASQSQEQLAPGTSTPAQGQPPASPQPQVQYIDVKEWGVRFQVPQQLRDDLSYAINYKAREDLGGPVKVDITSKQLNCLAVSFYYEVFAQPDVWFKQIGKAKFVFSGTACDENAVREGKQADQKIIAQIKEAVKNTLEIYDQPLFDKYSSEY